MMGAETPMPVFGLIARILARLALIGAVGAMRRRAGGAPPPWRTPPTGPTGPAPQPPCVTRVTSSDPGRMLLTGYPQPGGGLVCSITGREVGGH